MFTFTTFHILNFIEIVSQGTSVKDFSPYNMCNHHFFADNSGYKKHLKESPHLVVVCDPPFGARLELVFNTFELLKEDWSSCSHDDGKIDCELLLLHN